jgi:drug/metabolite transporter (DMT)-like permease
MKAQEQKELSSTINDTFMGLSGVVWCVMAGLCYGTMNVLAKLAYADGMILSRLILMRFSLLGILSYSFGKIVRKADFDFR